jgi:hypothetical protein
MFKAESGSLRFSSATATDAASGQQSADRTNGRGTALVVPEGSILRFKSALRLEGRGNQVQAEEYQRDHRGRG